MTGDDVVRIGAALANEKRYGILRAIFRGSLQTCCDRFEVWENGVCVADVVGAFKLSQSTVSHHLSILEEAGLVRRETRGLWTCYFPNGEAIEAFTAALREDLQKTRTGMRRAPKRDETAFSFPLPTPGTKPLTATGHPFTLSPFHPVTPPATGKNSTGGDARWISNRGWQQPPWPGDAFGASRPSFRACAVFCGWCRVTPAA
ncbi:MAG: ArsR/SmtB family transcription factor [Patescibacteria group bacterium]